MLPILRRWTMEFTVAFLGVGFIAFLLIYRVCTSVRPPRPLPELGLDFRFRARYSDCYVSWFENLILNQLWLPWLLLLLTYGLLRFTFRERQIWFDPVQRKVVNRSLHGEGDMNLWRLSIWIVLLGSTLLGAWWTTTPPAWRIF